MWIIRFARVSAQLNWWLSLQNGRKTYCEVGRNESGNCKCNTFFEHQKSMFKFGLWRNTSFPSFFSILFIFSLWSLTHFLYKKYCWWTWISDLNLLFWKKSKNVETTLILYIIGGQYLMFTHPKIKNAPFGSIGNKTLSTYK